VTSILAFVFVLGVLIFVHELGHFLMARRIGVRVLAFSLGFGPKLIGFRRGDTEYRISAVPLGGYVKMAGENPDDARSGAADEFLSKTKWQRFQVLVMGPVMNLVLAIVVMAVVLYQGAPVPAFLQQAPVIGSLTDQSPLKAAGLQPGDRFITVDGDPVTTWEELLDAVVAKSKRRVSVRVDRAGKMIDITFAPDGIGKYDMVNLDSLGMLPIMHPQVSSVQPNSPAHEAGLRPGDVVLAVAGESGITRERLVEVIKANEGKPIILQIKRNDVVQDVSITPRQIGDLVMIGTQLNGAEQRTIEPGPYQALKMSLDQNWTWTKMIVQTLGGLFTRNTSVKQLMGPVAIADLSGMAAEQGWLTLFSLMAMISLNLGLLNLMPIPVLDGGHIAILALEGVSRRDFSMKVKEKMLLAGFVVLLMLMVTVIYNDLMRIQWIEKLVPWR
jgi:regulator of sigma E protease